MPSIRNEDDRAKLPRWAQEQIESILRDKADLERQLAAGPEDSDTFVSGRHVSPDRPLGRHVTINFGRVVFPATETRGEVTQHVLDARWDAREQTLHVSSYQGTVHIIPWATNCFKVTVPER